MRRIWKNNILPIWKKAAQLKNSVAHLVKCNTWKKSGTSEKMRRICKNATYLEKKRISKYVAH